MTDLSTATAKAAVAKTTAPTLRDLVQAQQPAIEAQLAGAINSTAFVRAAISTIASSDALMMADPKTVLGGIMLAAQLKLEIGPALGHFYLTPRKEKGRQICLPIIGYKGYIELAYRSNRIEKIETFVVRDGDHFTHGANSERGRFFDWNPADYDETRDWTGVVGVAKIKGGGTIWAYLPKEKVLARRPHYWESTPWKTEEVQMARKTIIREMSPYLPMSTELARAIETDEQKVESINGIHDLVVTREEPETLVISAPLDPADPNYVEPSA